MLLIGILLLLVVFGGLGTYHGYGQWGYVGGGGIGLGTILLIILAFYLLRGAA